MMLRRIMDGELSRGDKDFMDEMAAILSAMRVIFNPAVMPATTSVAEDKTIQLEKAFRREQAPNAHAPSTISPAVSEAVPHDREPTALIPAPVTPPVSAFPFELEDLVPMTVLEINTQVQDLYNGTRVILTEIGDPSAIVDPAEKRVQYTRLFKLYREYVLLESEENISKLGQSGTEAYLRLGVRFRENLAELKP